MSSKRSAEIYMKILQIFEPYGSFDVHKEDPQ